MEKYLLACSVLPRIQQEVYENFHPKKRGENSKDVKSILPGIWKSLLFMTIFIKCGMHHIFRGVIAYCFNGIESFVTHNKLYSEFEMNINPYLKELMRLRLSLCNVRKFPMKKLLAENELEFSRIIEFTYGIFFV